MAWRYQRKDVEHAPKIRAHQDIPDAQSAVPIAIEFDPKVEYSQIGHAEDGAEILVQKAGGFGQLEGKSRWAGVLQHVAELFDV